jgi:hypothetical protein
LHRRNLARVSVRLCAQTVCIKPNRLSLGLWNIALAIAQGYLRKGPLRNFVISDM